MKNIKIQRLYLENFKCHKSLVLDFAGRNASIYGDNATGKTSIYDALTWLLFGKDSLGNGEKNIEIKPLDALGEVRDHLAVTVVEAVLLVDGEEITLRRTYQEVWSQKRGCSEATYDGNTSEYYVDGVPVKKYAFTEKVGELVDEDTFRLLTSVSHFASGISWQERRAALFRVAGVMDDAQIMATREDFAPLLVGMGRLSLDDYKKKLLSEKRAYTGAKNDLPARISGCRMTISNVEGIDFETARAELRRLDAQRESLEGQLLSIEHDAAKEKKAVEIREKKVELSALDGENRVYRSGQNAGDELPRLRTQHADLIAQKKGCEREVAFLEQNVAELDSAIAASRARWIEVHGRTFSGGTCPTCNQPLPTDQLKAATENFEKSKREHLCEIEQNAARSKEAKANAEARIRAEKEKIVEIEGRIAETESKVTLLAGQVTAVTDMPGYAEKRRTIEEQIHAFEYELAEMAESSAVVKGKLLQEIQKVKADAEKERELLAKETLLEHTQNCIEKLQAEAKHAAEILEKTEAMLYLIDEYTRYKTRFVEDSVNGLFRIARFRLFREQANGGVEDRCDVVYDGVPYINLNNGARINVGVDIINTLSRAYGVTVPLFVDNAESVTRLEGSNSQIIRLVVSEFDKELRVNYEG